MTKRLIHIIGNWKMHMGVAESEAFVHQLLPALQSTSSFVGIAPPFTSIEAVSRAAAKSNLMIGAQHFNEHSAGAYTGEVSASMLKELGVNFALVGHSERRALFHEDDRVIHLKVKRALETGMTPIVCIGETQEERLTDQTLAVLHQQLRGALGGLSSKELSQIRIAYEPVWAIGTGLTASPEVAQETHHNCRLFIAQEWGEEVARHLPMLYGGSVKPENANVLLSQPDIDGALVGGASLNASTFAQIIHYSQEYNL